MVANFSNAPNGDITITLENTSYETRLYFEELTTDATIVKNYFMLKTVSGAFVSFFLVDQTTGNPIAIVNGLVDIDKSINGSYQDIAERLTDGSGVASIFLKRTTQYRMTFSADGYTTQQFFITPSEASYTINMVTESAINLTTRHVFGTTVYSIAPATLYTNTTSITFGVTDSNNSLSFYGMNITWNNTQLYFANITGDGDGGNLIATINLENASGMYVNITAWFKPPDDILPTTYFIFEKKVVVDAYFVGGGAAGTLIGAVEEIPTVARLVIAIFIAMMLVMGTNRAGGSAVGSAVLVLIFLGFMTAIGWFTGIDNWLPLYSLMTLATFSIYILSSRW